MCGDFNHMAPRILKQKKEKPLSATNADPKGRSPNFYGNQECYEGNGVLFLL